MAGASLCLHRGDGAEAAPQGHQDDQQDHRAKREKQPPHESLLKHSLLTFRERKRNVCRMRKPTQTELRAELRGERARALLTQRQVAEAIGITPRWLREWERGDIELTPYHVATYRAAIARVASERGN